MCILLPIYHGPLVGWEKLVTFYDILSSFIPLVIIILLFYTPVGGILYPVIEIFYIKLYILYIFIPPCGGTPPAISSLLPLREFV